MLVQVLHCTITYLCKHGVADLTTSNSMQQMVAVAAVFSVPRNNHTCLWTSKSLPELYVSSMSVQINSLENVHVILVASFPASPHGRSQFFFGPQAMKSWAGPETEGSHVVSHLPQLPTSSCESHTDEIVILHIGSSYMQLCVNSLVVMHRPSLNRSPLSVCSLVCQSCVMHTLFSD